MLRLSHDLSDAYEAHFTRHGLSKGRFVVLVHLLAQEEAEEGEELEGYTPADLAEHAGVSRATMTGLLDTLEKDDLITRRDHPEDRRMYTVHLTPKGRRLLLAMLPDHYRRISALMSPLDDAERTSLRGLLAKVAGGIPALKDP